MVTLPEPSRVPVPSVAAPSLTVTLPLGTTPCEPVTVTATFGVLPYAVVAAVAFTALVYLTAPVQEAALPLPLRLAAETEAV
jgi:hypothetical protein